MKKMNKRGFTLVELIIVIVVIGILAGLAAPKFMGVVRDARHAGFVNDVDVMTTVATLIETQREQDEAVYGHDAAGSAVVFAEGADVVAAFVNAEMLDLSAAVDPLAPTDAEAKAAADALTIMPLDQTKYSANLSKSVKTGELENYFVITAGANAGTLVYLNDGGDMSAVATTTDFIGVIDGEGAEWFGLEIK